LATQLRSFIDYQTGEAETWEHMALTRARPVAGDAKLCRELETLICEVIARPRDEIALARSVRDMRALIATEKGDAQVWDLKLARGGMMDIEFIAQYLVLRHAEKQPQILNGDTQDVLRAAMRLGVLDAGQGETLVAAHRLYTVLMQTFRLATEGAFDPKSAASGVLRRIAAAANLPDFRLLETVLADQQSDVRGIFGSLLGKV
jgi:glutamate-ammonia-ligase adenylyltransferase